MIAARPLVPFLLVLALVVVLGRLVEQGSGPPTAETLVGALLFAAVSVGCRRWRGTAHRPWLGLLIAFALSLSGVAGMTAALTARSLDHLQFAWILGVALPGLLAWTWARGADPAPRGVLPGLLVCVGMVGLAAPPAQTLEHALWVAALGLLLPLLMTSRLLLRKPPVPAGKISRPNGSTGGSLGFGALLVAGLVLILAGGIGWGLESLVHALRTPAPDHLSLDPLELQDQAEIPDRPEGPLARIRCRPASDAPTLLWLRDRALEQVHLDRDALNFTERTGPGQRVLATQDGHVDQWTDLSSATNSPKTRDPALREFQITLLSPQVARLLLPPQVHRIEMAQVLLQADAAIPRPRHVGPFSYRLSADPDAYRGRSLVGGTALASSTATALPVEMPERSSLEELLVPWLNGEVDDLGRARSIERHLRSMGRFALLPPSEPASLEALAMGTRAGSSWEFATLFCALARLAGLPARPVVGYRVVLDATGEAEVRRSSAWAWAEVAFEETGWIAFDPTPVAAPAENAGDPTAGPSSSGAPSRVDPPRPPTTSRISDPTAEPPRHWLPWVLGALALISLGSWWRRRQAPRRMVRPPIGPPRQAWRYWRQFLVLCARRGWKPEPGMTPREFIRAVVIRMPAAGGDLQELVATYYGCRFGGEDLSTSRHRQLRQLLGRLATSIRAVSATQPRAPRRSTR